MTTDPRPTTRRRFLAGETVVVFRLLEDDDVVWSAPPIDTIVED